MAEFGASVTEAPQTPNFVTPQQGIVQEPVGIEGITNIFRGIREARAEGRAKKGEAFLSEFTNNQLALIQAVDQGSMSSQFARTKIRANLMQAINDFPQLRKELIQANSGILGEAGMGGIVSSGTKEEIRRENLRNTMVQQGMVSPDAGEEEFNQAQNNFILAQESKRRYDAEIDTIALERAKVGLTKDQLSLLKEREGRAAQDFLIGTAPALMEQFKNTSERLLGLIGTQGFEQGNVVSLIEERFNQFEQELSVPLSQVDSHTSQALMKGYREYKDLVVKRATGQFTQEAFDREIASITSKQQLVALNNPIINKAVALSKLGLNDLLLPEQLQVSEQAAKFLSDNLDSDSAPANLFTDSATGRKALDAYFKSISLNPNALTDEQKQEQTLHLERILTGVEDYESFISRNPEKGIGIVTDWMSTQQFFELRKSNPELFENNETAMRILQTNFGDEVWGMVDREFKKADILRISRPETVESLKEAGSIRQTASRTPVSEAVATRATSNGMEFFAIDDSDKLAVKKAKDLNKNLAPVINKNVKAFAHMEGSNDYRKFWEQTQERLFSNDDFEGSQGDDTLGLDDFSFPQVSSAGLPEDVANDTEFMSEVDRVASKFEIDPGTLLAVMDFETGGTFNPAERNKAGSSGTGLIQFMAATANSLGTSTQELASLSRAEQMVWVERYLDQFGEKIKGGSPSDVYMAVLFPKAIGKSDDFVLFRKGTKAYEQNRGLDKTKDGTVTKREAAAKVVSLVGKHS